MWNSYTFEELNDTFEQHLFLNICFNFVTEPKLQLNPVNTDTEGTIDKRVEFIPREQSKLSVIMSCPESGVWL